MSRSSAYQAALTLMVAGALGGCPSLGDLPTGGGNDASADAGFDVSPEAVSDAGSTDACTDAPSADPHNCGRCGHDCLGGACMAGQCQPVALISGQTGVYGLAVASGTLYFTNELGDVDKCPVDDCNNKLVQIASGEALPRRMTADTTTVYWSNEGFVSPEGGLAGSIAACGLAGCAGGMPTLLGPLENGPMDIAVDAQFVYWTTQFPPGVVRKCAITGCNGMPTTLATRPIQLSGVAVDATTVYWAEPKLDQIASCPLGSCASPTIVATGQDQPFELAVVGATLYWTNHGTTGAVMSCPTTGCGSAPTVFAAAQPSAYALAYDVTNLYWTTDGPGNVLRCPLSGCQTPTTLASGQGRPLSLVVDDTSVYWSNYHDGTVMRLAK